MAAGDTTQGTRLPDDASHSDVVDGPRGCYRLAPKSHSDDRTRYLHMLLPNGAFAMVPVGEDRAAPPCWALTEHEDGTITVSPSIWLKPTPGVDEHGWHGFLERGVWREV